MSIVPGFQHDVFVSYAHVDNLPCSSDPDSGWVHTLVDNLKVPLSQRLGHSSRGNIWLDRKLRGNEPFPGDIRSAVENSATLLVILSKGYVESDWCRREREAFLAAAERTGGARGRVFLVNPDDLDLSLWPDAFRELDLLGYPLFTKNRPDDPPRKLGYPLPVPGILDDRPYYERLVDLTKDIEQKLRSMTNAGSNDSVKVSTQPKVSIFLAETTPDLQDRCLNVLRHLEQMNIGVLPAQHYERSVADFSKSMERDLARCRLFVQLLGPYSSYKTPDLPTGYEGLQLDLAKASGLPILRWHDPLLAIDEVSDPELFRREEILAMPFEEFKLEIIRRAESVLPRTAPNPVEGETYVAISADESDGEAAENVMRILEQRTIGYEQVMGDELSKLVEDEDLGFNAVIVIYDRCEPVWAINKVRECRRIVMRKKSQAPVCGVYVGKARAHAPLQIRPPRFHFFSHPNDEHFGSFISELEKRVRREALG
jgi:TIR domain